MCRRQEPGEHLLCVGARSSVHPMRGQMWVSFLQEAAPALRLATWALSLLSQQAAHERRMQDSLSIQGIQVHVYPSHLISSFFSFLRMRGSRQIFLNLFCILWLTLLLKAASSSPLPHGNDPPAPSLPSGLYKGHTCVGMYSGFVCLLD